MTLVIRCRECGAQTNVDHPEAPASWVCPSCDAVALDRICPGPPDMAALKAARREADALFRAASAGRHADGTRLMELSQAVADLPDEAEELLEPRIRARFGMTLTEFHERLAEAVGDAMTTAQDDRRVRRKWFAHCIVPLHDWWVAQGWDARRWRADSADGESSAYLEFLSHELGRMESRDARDFAGVASAQKLAEAVLTARTS